MADLIDRDAIIAEYDRVHVGAPGGARKLMKDAPAVNRWIPVEDALPEENARCLVYTEGGGYGISRRMGRNLEKWNCFGLQITHWMPLPEPPEKE